MEKVAFVTSHAPQNCLSLFSKEFSDLSWIRAVFRFSRGGDHLSGENDKLTTGKTDSSGDPLPGPGQEQTPIITVDVNLYGTLARLAGRRNIAQAKVELKPGSTKADLLAKLGVPPEERGYLFINAVLYDVPGLDTDGQDPLQDGDHVGIFSTTYMWPYQYRDGVRMSESLKKRLQEHGSMHNQYSNPPG